MLRLVSQREAIVQGWLTLQMDEDSIEEEQALLINRGRDPMVHVPGIRFQRCGGGRRIIRKQRSTN